MLTAVTPTIMINTAKTTPTMTPMVPVLKSDGGLAVMDGSPEDPTIILHEKKIFQSVLLFF